MWNCSHIGAADVQWVRGSDHPSLASSHHWEKWSHDDDDDDEEEEEEEEDEEEEEEKEKTASSWWKS